jgi:hypothetical protein
VTVRLLAESPLVFDLPDFVDASAREALTAALSVPRLLDAGLDVRYGATGRTAEVPPAFHPALAEIARRIEALVGVPLALPLSFRVRHVAAGDAHPPHLDAYEVPGARLLATVMVYLDTAACTGGATVFPDAEPPLRLEPTPGRAVVWFNYGADGRPDPSTNHLLERVEAGHRLTMNAFVYAAPDAPPAPDGLAARAAARTSPASADGTAEGGAAPPELVCVDDTAAPASAAALERACRALGVRFRHVFAREVDPRTSPLEPGTMLYCVSTTAAAERVERLLWQPGVATFHRSPEGPFSVSVDPNRRFALEGLPVPRYVTPSPAWAGELPRLVDGLGGLPVVVKAGGGEGGVGTLRADSLPALTSLLDLLWAQGGAPTIMSFVPDALHLRLVVVGDRVVTAYRNPLRPDDFRSAPSADPADYDVEVDAEVAALAVRATHLTGHDFGGVDVLLHPSGRAYLLEANSPCYFPQAESFGKADVARAMVEALLARR